MPRIHEETTVYRSLDSLVEANGLCEVLDALARICIVNSENKLIGGDKALAREWDRAHRQIIKTSAHASVLCVSPE